jgi:hypothetical protein
MDGLCLLSFLEKRITFRTRWKLEGLFADIFCKGCETIFEGRGLFGAIAALHGAFSPAYGS